MALAFHTVDRRVYLNRLALARDILRSCRFGHHMDQCYLVIFHQILCTSFADSRQLMVSETVFHARNFIPEMKNKNKINITKECSILVMNNGKNRFVFCKIIFLHCRRHRTWYISWKIYIGKKTKRNVWSSRRDCALYIKRSSMNCLVCLFSLLNLW